MFGKFKLIPFSKVNYLKNVPVLTDNQRLFSSLTSFNQQSVQQNEPMPILNKTERGNELSYFIQDNQLELKINGWKDSLKLHLDWLRDSCQCSVCRERSSSLCFASLPSIVDGTRIKSVKSEDDQIIFTWSDDHRTICKSSWLRNKYANGKGQTDPRTRPSAVGLPAKTVWDSARAKTIKFAHVDYNDILKCEDSVRHFLSSILEYGFAVVDKVPTNDGSTRSVMERFGPLWPTFWGEIYHVVADLTVHSHPSYTAGDLGLHNDTNYYFEGAGLQAFHVLEHTGTGGTNKLVDGFYIAQKIQLEHPDVYDYLSTRPFSFKYIADQKLHLFNEDTILKHDSVTNELIQIRFTPYDFDTFRTVPQNDVAKHYQALHLLRNELDNPNNAHWLQLNPGKLLVTDNWRVLHGRSSFTGRRVLCGMYISRCDFLSRARKLGLL